MFNIFQTGFVIAVLCGVFAELFWLEIQWNWQAKEHKSRNLLSCNVLGTESDVIR